MTKRSVIVYMAFFLNQEKNYSQVSNIRGTKSQNWNVFCLVLQLSLRNLLKPGV